MTKRMKMALAMLAALAGALTCPAQVERNTAEQVNAWLPVICNMQLSEKWTALSDVQVRRAHVVQQTQQYVLRAGIERKIMSDLAVSAGYAFAMTYPYGEQPAKRDYREHRLWEQLTIPHRAGRVAIQHRYRLEQRWQQRQQDDKRDEYAYLNRIRYRLQANVPINKPDIEEGCVFASVSNELFVNFGRNAGMNIFDQNRVAAAIGLQVTKSIQAQCGYLNQVILKSSGIDMEVNHTIMAGITFNIDLKEKQ